MGSIYSIMNKVTNKAYIGQTVQTVEKRVKKHFALLRRDGHPNIYLQRSYNLYGEEAFEYFTICEISNQILNNTEIMLIALFQTDNDLSGYNLTKGGAGVISKEAQKRQKQSNQDRWPDVLKICPLTLRVLARYPSQNVAAKENGVPLSHINQACNFKGGKRHGFHWILETDHLGWKPPLHHRAKPYCLVDSTNRITHIFRSETIMEKEAKTSKPVIKKRANTSIPLLVEGKELFIRPLSVEEYHSYNIGTCIDYPR